MYGLRAENVLNQCVGRGGAGGVEGVVDPRGPALIFPFSPTLSSIQ